MIAKMHKTYTKEHRTPHCHPFAGTLVAFLLIALASLSTTVAADCPTPERLSDFHSGALQAFTARYDQDFWLQPGRLATLARQLEALESDGLSTADYHLSAVEKSVEYMDNWGVILSCDAKLASYVYMQALSDLHFSRARTLGVDPVWYSPQTRVLTDSNDLLELAMAGETDITNAFDKARPTLARYQNLRLAYQKALATQPESWPYLAPGPTLTAGDTNPRVSDLRIRLAIEDYYSGTGTEDLTADYFDEQLADALKNFQRRHNLQADGKAGPATRRQLNVTPGERLDQLRANLERIRWFAADVDERLLLVDIAAAKTEYYAEGELIWSGRAQVGLPERETPQLKSIITHVTVNPPWHIPTSIFLRDQLPRVRQNPNYLSERNIRVFDRQGNERAASDIDWNRPHQVTLRQDSGPSSALGLVAIRFSNPFAVYLHDTPSRWLFNTQERFYSSGCVRVEDALDLTRALFETSSTGRNRSFEQALASGKTKNVHLERGVPLIMAYWTADADSNGTVYYRADIYQDDKRVLTLLDRSAL